MGRVLVSLGTVMLVLGLGSFFLVRSSLLRDRQRAADAAAQMGRPELADAPTVALHELVDFEALAKKDGGLDALAYLGCALGGGGLVCLLGGLAVNATRKQPAAATTNDPAKS